MWLPFSIFGRKKITPKRSSLKPKALPQPRPSDHDFLSPRVTTVHDLASVPPVVGTSRLSALDNYT